MFLYLTLTFTGSSEFQAVVRLAWDPAGPGPRGLSVLAATCYFTDNALTHHHGTDRNYAYNHRICLPFLLVKKLS